MQSSLPWVESGPTAEKAAVHDLLLVVRGYHDYQRDRCAHLWRRHPDNLRLELSWGAAGRVVRLRGGQRFKDVLETRCMPGLPLPQMGEEMGWLIFWGRCWWLLGREKGCKDCHCEPCRCLLLSQELEEQLDLAAWFKARPYFK